MATEATWLKCEQTWKAAAKVCLGINRLQLHEPEVEDKSKFALGRRTRKQPIVERQL
jgi:hypothetical protein